MARNKKSRASKANKIPSQTDQSGVAPPGSSTPNDDTPLTSLPQPTTNAKDSKKVGGGDLNEVADSDGRESHIQNASGASSSHYQDSPATFELSPRRGQYEPSPQETTLQVPSLHDDYDVSLKRSDDKDNSNAIPGAATDGNIINPIRKGIACLVLPAVLRILRCMIAIGVRLNNAGRLQDRPRHANFFDVLGLNIILLDIFFRTSTAPSLPTQLTDLGDAITNFTPASVNRNLSYLPLVLFAIFKSAYLFGWARQLGIASSEPSGAFMFLNRVLTMLLLVLTSTHIRSSFLMEQRGIFSTFLRYASFILCLPPMIVNLGLDIVGWPKSPVIFRACRSDWLWLVGLGLIYGSMYGINTIEAAGSTSSSESSSSWSTWDPAYAVTGFYVAILYQLPVLVLNSLHISFCYRFPAATYLDAIDKWTVTVSRTQFSVFFETSFTSFVTSVIITILRWAQRLLVKAGYSEKIAAICIFVVSPIWMLVFLSCVIILISIFELRELLPRCMTFLWMVFINVPAPTRVLEESTVPANGESARFGFIGTCLLQVLYICIFITSIFCHVFESVIQILQALFGFLQELLGFLQALQALLKEHVGRDNISALTEHPSDGGGYEYWNRGKEWYWMRD